MKREVLIHRWLSFVVPVVTWKTTGKVEGAMALFEG
jgi:hypothetical protein